VSTQKLFNENSKTKGYTWRISYIFCHCVCVFHSSLFWWVKQLQTKPNPFQARRHNNDNHNTLLAILIATTICTHRCSSCDSSRKTWN